MECYKMRMHLAEILCKFSKYKLALINVRLTIATAVKDQEFMTKLPAHGKILMSTLDKHLDLMTKNSEMCEIFSNIQNHYEMEAQRIKLVYHQFVDIEAPDFFNF